MLLPALAVALFVVIPLIAELSPVSPRYVTVDPIADSGAFRVFVADWGYHTSIIVEQPSGTQLGPPGREARASRPQEVDECQQQRLAG